MKRIATLLLVTGALLSGCVMYEPEYHDRGMHRGEYERNRDHDHDRGQPYERDSDRDGVPDRMDRRPYDRSRY